MASYQESRLMLAALGKNDVFGKKEENTALRVPISKEAIYESI